MLFLRLSISTILIIFVLTLYGCMIKPAKSEFSIPQQEFKNKYSKIAIFPSTFYFAKSSKHAKADKPKTHGGTFGDQVSPKAEAQKDKIEMQKRKSVEQYGSFDESLSELDREIMFRLYHSKSMNGKEIMLPKDSTKIVANIMRKMKIKNFYNNNGEFDKKLFISFIKKFSKIAKADAIIVNFLELTPAKLSQFSGNTAEWDGKREEFAKSTKYRFVGEVLALSLVSYMISASGQYIWEGRGGIALLEKISGSSVTLGGITLSGKTSHSSMTTDPKGKINIYKLLGDPDRRRSAIKNVFYSFKIKK